MRASANFIATVGNDFQGQAFIKTLKQGVKQRPRFVYAPDAGRVKKCRWVVRVRGRLGKNSEFKHLYAVGGPLHRRTAQDIRQEHADRLDVYVQQIIVW